METRVEGTSTQEVDVEEVAEVEEDTAEQTALKKQRRDEAPSGSRIDAMFSSLLGPHTGEASSVTYSLDEELRVYLMEPLIDRCTGDPLQWWKEHKDRFKHLSKEASKFLCLPPSSVPSERVFSEISAIYSKNRNRLTGEHAEQLCFLHYNIILLNWEYQAWTSLIALEFRNG